MSEPRRVTVKETFGLQALRIVLAFSLFSVAVEVIGAPADQPTTEQIVTRMAEADRITTPQLRDYTSLRRYVLENKRFGFKAEMTVRMAFRYPGHKEFKVISEQGMGTIRKRVFQKMLESEVEASRDDIRDSTQITARNYSFQLTGSEEVDGRKSFILEATPKTKSKYLFQGKIWVDSENYGIARIEGSPAQNPSFWVRKTAFVHKYRRFGPFWLAVSNTSLTDALMFGKTDVSIEYSDYRINEKAEH